MRRQPQIVTEVRGVPSPAFGNAVNYGWTCIARIGDTELWGDVTVDEEDLLKYLLADAAAALKPGTRFEIRKRYPTMYGRSHGMAWYREAEMDARETWGVVPAKPTANPERGYMLVGEYVTPKETTG